MFDSTAELLERIRLGEDSFLELKAVRLSGSRLSSPHRDAVADELSAFANARGGVLVLGVEDKTREIVGIAIEALDEVERTVRDLCTDAVEPPLAPTIERLLLTNAASDRVPVIKVSMPRSLFVHRSPGGYLHRVGSAKRVMSTDYLARLFQQRSQTRMIRFDEQPVADAAIGDLRPELWQRFRTTRSDDDDRDFLTKLGLARQDDDGVTRPTVAGVLLASDDPRRWLPQAFVQAVAYRGDRISPRGAGSPYQLDAADITGPLDVQAIEASRFVAKNMKVAAFKDIGRRDLPQFALDAVFEALVNAVAHRDYSIHGSKIRLRLFENRLELYSPGGIPNTMSLASLPYRQAARNEALTSLLAKCPIPQAATWLETDRLTMMDKRGEGVRIILEDSETLSGHVPEYRLIDDAELLLTIYAADPMKMPTDASG